MCLENGTSKSTREIARPRGLKLHLPHHNVTEDWCQLLKTDCVPGRSGCVLDGKSVFLVPVEERIRDTSSCSIL